MPSRAPPEQSKVVFGIESQDPLGLVVQELPLRHLPRDKEDLATRGQLPEFDLQPQPKGFPGITPGEMKGTTPEPALTREGSRKL